MDVEADPFPEESSSEGRLPGVVEVFSGNSFSPRIPLEIESDNDRLEIGQHHGASQKWDESNQNH